MSEEYYCDLFQRTVLYLALQQASPEQVAQYSVRIDRADQIFKENTIETDNACDPCTNDIKKPEKKFTGGFFGCLSKVDEFEAFLPNLLHINC